MAKNLQYVKVFELLQSSKGPVTVSKVKAIPGIVSSRLSTYMWEIKKNTGFAVKANRDGRAVVSYELIGSGTAPVAKTATPKVAKVKTPKAPKAPKAPKTKSTKSVVVESLDNDEIVTPSTLKDSQVYDALDDIDTTIMDMDDKEFASDYVKGM
jgi:hypothetical protein